MPWGLRLAFPDPCHPCKSVVAFAFLLRRLVVTFVSTSRSFCVTPTPVCSIPETGEFLPGGKTRPRRILRLAGVERCGPVLPPLSLIHISEPTRRTPISY